MGAHIYDLNTKDNGAMPFYENLSETTSEILDMLYNDPSIVHVREFGDFISDSKTEPSRSTGEYLIEYIMIGLFWKQYAGNASGLSRTVKKMADLLYSARQTSSGLKPAIDRIRGKIASRHLIKKDKSYELVPIVENLGRLIEWLDATKDFREEVKRLSNWFSFLKKKSPIYVSRFLNTNKEVFERFISIARKNLSIYTKGVQPFTESVKRENKNREDLIFCSRSEDEYFFNMIAAEILNRALKPQFEATKRKIVLLPTCMSAPAAGTCKSRQENGNSISCSGCSAGCRVNKIRQKIEKQGMEVSLIPHALDFSKYLRQWAGNSDIGLIGVACVLNLLSGGYEMISLGIPGQFIFLDYCSCTRHWPGANQSTDLNTDELFRTLNISESMVSNL